VSAAFIVVSAGAAGAAFIVSAGAGAGEAAGAVVDVESVALVELLLLLPQEATKRPIERARIPNFTNFIIVFLSG